MLVRMWGNRMQFPPGVAIYVLTTKFSLKVDLKKILDLSLFYLEVSHPAKIMLHNCLIMVVAITLEILSMVIIENRQCSITFHSGDNFTFRLQNLTDKYYLRNSFLHTEMVISCFLICM